MISALFNRRSLILVVAFIAAVGIAAIQNLPRAEDPTIKARSAAITTLYPGADAQRVEALLSQPIEEEVRTLEQVDSVSSVSRAGVSIVSIVLKDEITETAPVWSRVRDLLSDLEGTLPDDASTPDLDDEGGYAYTVAVAVKWDAPSPANQIFLQRYGDELGDRLRSIPGTDHVEVHGSLPEIIRVDIDQQSIRAAGLTLEDVARTLAQADVRGSAGNVANAQTTMTVELTGAFDSLSRLRSVPLISAGGETLSLGDVATLTRTTSDPPSVVTTHNGVTAVIVGSRMQLGQRVDLWVPQVLAAVEEFRARQADGIAVEVIFEQASYTTDRLTSVLVTLLQGLLIVVAVLILTMGIRSAISVGITIPLVALLTLGVFPFVGLELHQMSIVGIIVALGLMVDNAIIMTNDIRDDLAHGESFAQAATGAIRKLFFPLLASTTTTMLAFSPIVMAPGAGGEFVGPMAFAVLCALFSSFVISMFIVPALSPILFKEGPRASETTGRYDWLKNGVELPNLARRFRGIVGFFLHRPRLALAASFLIPLIGFVALPTIPTAFFPATDRDQFRIEVRMAQASSIYASAQIVKRIDQAIREEEGVAEVLATVGAASPQLYYNAQSSESQNPAFADLVIDTDSDADTARLVPLLQQKLSDQFPEASIAVIQYGFGPPLATPVEMRIIGTEFETLAQLGVEAASILANIDGVVGARAAVHRDAAKIEVDVNEVATARAGLSLGDVARQLDNALIGQAGGFVLEETEQLPVLVRFPEDQRDSIADVESISLTPPSRVSQSGVPLSSIGSVRIVPAWVDLQRLDGERIQVVSSFVAKGYDSSVILAEFQSELEEQGFQLPPGYRIEWGGEAEARGDAITQLLSQVAILLVIAVTILVLVFNSFRRMLIVAGSGVIAIGFGFFALFVSGHDFAFLIIVGVMGLIGVGINDTIVVISALDEDEEARTGDPDAIRDVVTGSVARHVWSTTITTAGGFIPLALFPGEFWPPFAQTFAGGLLGLTVIAFIYTPAAYLLAVRARHRSREHPISPAKTVPAT
ncbi:acriflavine resistance protein B [Erythrobacter sp. KY5]|uniref:efflux RND transporter permease subunit n=1 Tax=Erythrobacter sp. KY5 TaxID=2011159 RepID=UPI000DBEF7F6|nr:efflux RND transporter permease subunit [Erythrobacter sp. KY5]AWW74392.1 acriflavine resistance protein B [Erythrobacter sp. KY5]